MVARIWRGSVPAEKARAYLKLLHDITVSECRRTRGNKGTLALHRRVDNVVHIIMLTLWESCSAIEAFVGPDIDRAKYYEFDQEYLLEMEPRVQHYFIVD